MPRTVRARQSETVDAICDRVYGVTADITEAAYASNPGLADLGPTLPIGTPVVLPDPPDAAPVNHTVQLWD